MPFLEARALRAHPSEPSPATESAQSRKQPLLEVLDASLMKLERIKARKSQGSIHGSAQV